MPHLIIATRNAHKAHEIQAVLGDRFAYLTLRAFPEAPEVAETGDSFDANARLKAESLAQWLLLTRPSPYSTAPTDAWFVLADDSGLEVDALGGAPGVQSARFAASELGLAGNAPDAANNAKLLRLLAEIPVEKRTARFRCVLAFTPLSQPLASLIFSGACEGGIGFVPRGAHGFGYDPLFVPDGFDQTFAELGEATKDRISHRSQALQALQHHLRP